MQNAIITGLYAEGGGFDPIYISCSSLQRMGCRTTRVVVGVNDQWWSGHSVGSRDGESFPREMDPGGRTELAGGLDPR